MTRRQARQGRGAPLLGWGAKGMEVTPRLPVPLLLTRMGTGEQWPGGGEVSPCF